MKFKIFSLVLLTLFLSVLTVSAATNFSVSTTSLDFSEPTTSMSFTLTPLYPSSNYSISLPIIYANNNNAISLTSSGNLLNISTAQLITIGSNVDFTQISLGKSYPGTILIQNMNNPADNQTISVDFTKSFCKYGENGTDLSISDVKVRDAGTTDDTQWKPLDQIEIDVRVENTGTVNARQVDVELGLLDSSGRNVINDMDNLNDNKIELGTIDSGNDATAKFTFNVPIGFSEDDYKLVAKAYSAYRGEKGLCTASSSAMDNNAYQSISGTRESNQKRQIIVNNIQVTPTTAQCGDKVQVSADVVNVGDTDYTDQVKVNMYNQELGINTDQIIRQDFNQGDSSTVNFEFDVPPQAKEKAYTLEFTTYYNYDTQSDNYRITSDRKFVNFNSPFNVQGNCQPTLPPQNVNAQITSTDLSPDTPEAIAGNKVVVLATIKNTGDVDTNYLVSVNGNSDWSNLVSIDPQSLTISPGSSKVVSITLDLNKDAVGTKDFSIGLAFANKTTQYNVGDFAITEATPQQTDVIAENFRSNWLIYVIVLVNIVLIIAIIMVIRRMLRPRAPRM